MQDVVNAGNSLSSSYGQEAKVHTPLIEHSPNFSLTLKKTPRLDKQTPGANPMITAERHEQGAVLHVTQDGHKISDHFLSKQEVIDLMSRMLTMLTEEWDDD